MTDKTIHLVFKTHLDIGFSNLAENVRREYHRHFIPQALTTAEHFFGEDPRQPKFIWTTGAWLIADYLAGATADEAARLERAIERGLIRWHALPFTTHSELMSPDLFRAGLSYARELDRRFGRKTLAAKMTDVPGHTLGIVPLLAEAGIRFLHLGVNEASPVPDIPPVFRWRAPNGEEVVVLYHDSYGGTYFPDSASDGLSFAHTNDNAGPQTISQTVEIYRNLQKLHPGATIVASTLDAYGEILWARREHFPCIETEIGDSWIHGVGTDPTKVSRFLALQRLYDEFAADQLSPAREAFGRALALVPEHTWGVDIKTFLRDEAAWDRPAFAIGRKTDPRFAFAERSWMEQRQYLDHAIAKLDAADQAKAVAAWSSTLPMPMAGTQQRPGKAVDVAGWLIGINPARGDIVDILSPQGRALYAQADALIGYRYESYDSSDMQRHLDSYLTRRPEWAILDHDKPGLAGARTAVSALWAPKLTSVTLGEHALSIVAEMPDEAVDDLGAPATVELVFEPQTEARFCLTLVLRNKAANRMPEASFLIFTPAEARDWQYRKTGLWQNPHRTVARGGGQLQAVQAVGASLLGNVRVTVKPLDTPLVAPCQWPFMVFNPSPPDLAGGIRFNLHNNKWGTNFPMWWDGGLLARFLVELEAA